MRWPSNFAFAGYLSRYPQRPHACRHIEPQRKLQAVTAGRLWDEAKNIKLLKGAVTIPLLIAGETRSDLNASPAMKSGVASLGRLEKARCYSCCGRARSTSALRATNLSGSLPWKRPVRLCSAGQ